MRSRHFENIILILLGIALVAQILLLLWHMNIISFKKRNHSQITTEAAGTIVKSQNNLKRRALNSLVWENSHSKDVIYYHDSMLTLSQSAATLQLENGTEIHLSENTLVTVEPPDTERHGEIRLRFSKGNLKARNSFSKSQIEAESFVVDLEKGSELSLHQIGEKDFEISVTRGTASVTSLKGTQNISPEDILRLNKDGSERYHLNKNLSWIKTPEKRVYTHTDRINAYLSWQGKAKSIMLQSQGKNETEIALVDEQKEIEIDLPLGSHRLYLKTQKGLSTPIPIQVWKAPVIHLIEPLPRNRVLLTHTRFLWTRHEEASSYVIKINGNKYKSRDVASTNTYLFYFDKEDDAHWSVWTKDKEGFLIPPLYDYPIYIREKPFAAPKLNEPILLKPKKINFQKSTWLWNLLLPQAHAKESILYEALFSWQAIKGADLYWLEISETADFRNPIVQVTTKNTQYIWNRVDQKKTYYWRVAAGNSTGRMGLFSDPAKVKLELSKPKIIARPEEDSYSTGAAVIKPKTFLAKKNQNKNRQPSSEKKEDTSNKLRTYDTKLLFRAGFSSLVAEAPTNINANLSGFIYSSLNLETLVTTKNTLWTLGIKYTQSKYEPDPESSYPFQENLSIPQGEIYAAYQSSQSACGFGLMGKLIPNISRQSFEAVKNENHFMYGPIWQGLWKDSHYEYRAHLGGLFSDEFIGGFTSHRLLFSPGSGNIMFGGELEFGHYSGTEKKLTDMNVYLLLGLEF